jgi:hypothetical protein
LSRSAIVLVSGGLLAITCEAGLELEAFRFFAGVELCGIVPGAGSAYPAA